MAYTASRGVAARDEPALAEPALAVALEERQLYPEVAAALDRLAALVPLLAVTNGSADLERTGVECGREEGCCSCAGLP